MEIPGVGPLLASAFVATVSEPPTHGPIPAWQLGEDRTYADTHSQLGTELIS